MRHFQHAIRVLLKNPGFSLVAVLTLALGIGLNVTVFSILNVLMLKPLPVAHADELVWISGRSTGPERGPLNLAHADVVDFRQATAVVRDVAAFAESPMAVGATAHSMRVTGQVVTGNYFDVLGVPALAGRLLTGTDDRLGADPVAVISESLMRRLGDAPSSVLGRTITINGHPHTLVGVAPVGFRGVDILTPADVWVPVAAAVQVLSMGDPYHRESWWLKGLARLADGVDLQRAQTGLGVVATAIAQQFPDSHKGFGVALQPIRGVAPKYRSEMSVLALLPMVPVVVLLIACANVASLLIARGAGRQRELSIRRALGASQGQLVRLLLAESATLAFAGGACGLLVSMWTPELLVRFADAPIAADFSPDARVLLFTFAVSAATAILFGLAPALRAARAAAHAAALRGSPGAAESGAARPRLQRSLVAAQLGMSLILLLAAGTFITSVLEARRTHVGFERAGRVTASLDLELQQYTDERAHAFRRALLERVSALPGIHRATVASFVPLGDRVMVMPFYPAGQPVDVDVAPDKAAVTLVGPGFFETLQLPIRRGRPLDEADGDGRVRVVVVNERLASRLTGDGDVLGRRIVLGDPSSPPLEIVGIAADVVVDELGAARMPAAYLPMEREAGEFSVIAWTSLEPARALKAIEETVRSLDASLAIFDPMTMDQHLASRLDTERGLSRLLSLAGALALGLAAFGLYGVTAYAVNCRTREIGVRIALGADRRNILHLVLGEALGLAALGLGAGLVPGLLVTYLLSSQIFGARAVDPAAILAATGFLTATAMIAAFLPARRALRVDPIVALRAE
jgi:predicted permease